MQYLSRVAGIAALALSTAALYGCYALPPPFAAEVAPDQTLPPPPPAVGMVTPYQTPSYPSSADTATASAAPYASRYATPQYGSTAPVAEVPSNAGTTVIVAPYAPPPLRAEAAPPAPSALAMWQPGHWNWDGTQYAWVAGHYDERPSPSANWTPGYWQQGPAGWTWINGYWS
jgi:WXXGXW repeat (2 copies)